MSDNGGKKKKDKKIWVIIVATIILVIAVAVLAYLNAGSAARKKELEMNAEFVISSGAKQYRVTMGEILDMEPEEFDVIMRTSTTGPAPTSFTGVEVSKILENYRLEIENSTVVTAKALDGYVSAITGEEILTPGNVYICIYMNGKPLKAKSEGGSGPYYLVIKNVQFAQRWCKFLEELVVE